MIKKILLLITVLMLVPAYLFAATHYVSPTGSAAWGDCTAAETPCSLATANSSAVAGDTVILATGSYSTALIPANSGTGSGAGRIIFQKADGATPVLDGADGGNSPGLYINGKDWIKVDGITVKDWKDAGSKRLVSITGGADYNEITNCTFYQSTQSAVGTPSISINAASTHTWFHGNTLHDIGTSDNCVEGYGVMAVGSWQTGATDSDSNYTTIEDNIIYHGGHHTLQSYTHYNVIRNNLFHNEGWQSGTGCTYTPDDVGSFPGNGKFGHRNIEFQHPTDEENTYVLIEGNRIGYASVNSTNNGTDQITLTTDANLIRYNDIFGGDGNAIYFKSVGSPATYPAHNRIFNNTITDNGRAQYAAYEPTHNPPLTRPIHVYASDSLHDNILKNNLFYNNNAVATNYYYSATDPDFYGLSGNRITATNNYCVSGTAGVCSANGATDPKFTSYPAITQVLIESRSKTSPDLTLQSDSPAIAAGTFLTQANGAGTNSTTLIVDDAKYFQDGTWGSSLSDIQADWIKVGTVTVQISSINYATNTITLASAISWADNAEIRLYKKSDGVQVLYGSETDMGAHEYAGATTHTITASKTGEGGTLTPTGDETVADGADSLTYTQTPASGYRGTWSGTCGATGTGATYQKTNVTADCTVVVTFDTIKIGAILGPGVTYDANEATSGTVPSTRHYLVGATVTVSANTGTLAKTGYTFSKWNTAADGSGTDYDPADTFTIAGNVTLYAKWEPIPPGAYGNIIPTMASDSSASPVLASAENESVGGAYYAFDHVNLGSYWGGNAEPNWIEIDFGATQLLRAYKMVRSPVGAYYPTAWTFSGYNGATWDTLDTQTGQAPTEAGIQYVLSAIAQYQRYRWNITTNNALGRPVIGEIEAYSAEQWISPTMTAADAPSPYVVTYSSQYSATYTGWKAMDGDVDTFWNIDNAQTSAGSWWKLYVGETRVPVVNKLSIKNGGSSGLKSFKVQGCNDDSSWSDIYTGTALGNTVLQTFSFENTVPYKYIRILCTEGYAANNLAIYVIVMEGYIPNQ